MGVRVVDLASTSFRAMGTDVEVLVVDGSDHDLHWARAEVEQAEDRWSRFRPCSDVGRLSANSGTWVAVAAETIDLLQQVLRAQASTGGAFDPLLGSTLGALGYDRTFEGVDLDGAGVDVPAPRAVPSERLCIHDRAPWALLPAGTALDLGGIAKGWTADGVAARLVARGARGACVNVGGDLAVAGDAPDPAGWVIDVRRTDPSTLVDRLALRSGGLATSTTQRRAWVGPRGDRRHHLLDPTTGEPCAGALVEVTVVAASAAAAEVLTKVAFAAPERFEAGLREQGAVAIQTMATGEVLELGDRVLLDALLLGRTHAG